MGSQSWAGDEFDGWVLVVSLAPNRVGLAALTADDVPDFELVRSRYEMDPRFSVNGTLLSYVNGNMVQVNVA